MIYTKARERIDRMLALRALGLTCPQIADRLGMREASVRIALFRKRKEMARAGLSQVGVSDENNSIGNAISIGKTIASPAAPAVTKK